MDDRQPLADCIALDLSESIAGQYCARLLADYGAAVTLVEPASGSVIRSVPPFDPDTGQSLLFRHLNKGKHSAVFDEGLIELAMSKSDIVLVGTERDGPALAAAYPNSIVATVSGFGRDGPLAHWQGSELIYQALSSVMLSNGARDREPLYGVGHRASYAAGVATYIGILSALLERQSSGLGQHIDVSVAETAATMTTGPTAYAYSGKIDSGRGHSDSLIRCRGEWVLIWIYPVQWRDFCEALDLGALVDDARFADKDIRQTNWRELMALLEARFGNTPADEVVERLQQRRLITAKAASPTGLLHGDAHLAARNFWQSDGGGVRLRRPYMLRGAHG